MPTTIAKILTEPANRYWHLGLTLPLAALALGVQAETGGRFSAPFAEPTIVVDGEVITTDQKCVKNAEGLDECKPAAGTMALLENGRILYLNALEGTENVELSIVAEFGEVSINDQTRVLELGENDQPTWTKPAPLRAGANPDGNDSETLLNGTDLDGLIDTADNTSKNDGALFCSDVIGLADGRVMAVGGTDYYSEPGIDGLPLGVAELEGIKNSRIYNPATNSWTQSGDMTYGRWYPSMVTLPDSRIFVASGVTKLVKPVYPEDPLNSGRNVVQTETYDPCAGTWSQNPASADRSLPLYPRLHLLPNGHVLYNAGGQAFNPFGQGYDQALWNIAASYDPDTQRWTDLGYAGLPLRLDELGLGQLTSTLNVTNLSVRQVTGLLGDLVQSAPELLTSFEGTNVDAEQLKIAVAGGMRGSTSSTMLPLRPNARGEYTDVKLLTAGGVPSYAIATNPGGYLPVAQSRIDTIRTDGDRIDYESSLTGPLNQPRWYGTNVLMPDGSVMVFSGANRDGVVGPGLDTPIRTAERFDPETRTWTEMASANQPRTYHNTALLLPDGRVLLGGHAPINTAYLSSINLEDFGFSPNDGRDPSFEIYTPPYADRNDRPEIRKAPKHLTVGQTFRVTVDDPDVDKVLLIRQTVMTHLIDGDQRAVELPIQARMGNRLTLRMPARHSVVPAGKYMLFASKDTAEGRVPSEAAIVTVVNTDLACMAPAEVVEADTGEDEGGLLDTTTSLLGFQ
ncbi:MAG: galactose oxidase-like domain-containing protein [Marinobacter sp.]|uniref:galactose oxidase-like domain-containing protein n=1 Tax=Marinobacter sp. TaxID=50741 RepID=UPI00299E2128|nr:galactose oxidase-like domain-containing protein [Marinobacter sp.]MDX1633273.1 galactose oxidase-like domain-containing protein [Marinobacter sp.]